MSVVPHFLRSFVLFPEEINQYLLFMLVLYSVWDQATCLLGGETRVTMNGRYSTLSETDDSYEIVRIVNVSLKGTTEGEPYLALIEQALSERPPKRENKCRLVEVF